MSYVYPTESDLQAFLVSAGVVSSAPSGVAAYVDGAIAEWESMTGFRPFLGESSDSTSYYDGPYPSRFLDLLGGYVSITSLAIGITATDTTGTAQTANEDWFAKYQGQAITGVEFSGLVSGSRSIKIVGKKGYSATLPADAYQAILQKAAADAFPYLTQGGDAKRIKQGPVEYEFNESQIGLWKKGFENAVRRHRRV